MVTKEILLPLLMPAKNRTTVNVAFKRRISFATTALLGLAPVRSARASAATTGGNLGDSQPDDSGVANGKATSK
jgi:hypothetical protein